MAGGGLGKPCMVYDHVDPMTKLRYSQFAHKIDVDAFEAAIDFDPISQERGWDIGHCLWPENHKHGDLTGKFAIYREGRTYNCYVCGGGTILSLAMELRNLDVDQATEWLYQFTHGEQQTADEYQAYLLEMLDDAEQRVETMPYFNERVLDRFDGQTDYFHNRGISEATYHHYRLRYHDSVLKVAPSKLDRNGERVKIDEDYYGPATIWPHYWQERLVGWQYRWLDWDTDHTNTPK